MRFHERQQFRQWWVWALLLAVTLPPLALFAHAMYEGKAVPGAISFGTFLLLVGILVLMYYARLDVVVTDEELVIRFFPFHIRGRRIPLREISAATARRYEPITEFGGWGIRYGFRGMAYNVSGSEGVQLVLVNGKRILIGSQKSAELAAALTR